MECSIGAVAVGISLPLLLALCCLPERPKRGRDVLREEPKAPFIFTTAKFPEKVRENPAFFFFCGEC